MLDAPSPGWALLAVTLHSMYWTLLALVFKLVSLYFLCTVVSACLVCAHDLPEQNVNYHMNTHVVL